MKKAAFCTILLVLGIFLLGALPAAAALYTCKELPTFGGMVYAYGINASGQVVGAAQFDAGYRAFLYSGGDSLKNLGTLPAPYNISSYAYGINATGQVVGYSTNSSGFAHAFFYSGGNMLDLSTLLGPDTSEALSINDAGLVAGYYITGNPRNQVAFVYDSSKGTMQFPGTLGGNSSSAWGINASGQVVGASSLAPPPAVPPDHAFLWQSGVGMQDLGTLGPTDPNTDSLAYAVNAAGQVVGRSNTSLFSPYHAFLWSGGGMQDLGTLSGATYASYAYGINSAGQVVGSSDTASGTNHAFLYSGGVMSDLNSLVVNLPEGDPLISANAINNRGQIAAINNLPHAILLTPVAPLAGVDLLLQD